jgi:hypothetical protein
MNERIEELKLQAIDFADATYKYDLREGFQIQEWDKIRLEKFAELIIKECIAQIEVERGNPYRNIGDVDANGISACDESIRRIKEHFGVEE